ncbi:hypothetical protein [Biformimicrobium ophioploci]|uniref:Uncharacterized protein n=1 Tax=Biformimicrobium ophioploci TaxID=3036711 RepID=A0ABQ6M268_9GAMM|nr:hypothetical protein [Microbulbifer sp. NKW57]GMG88411.1 hypothetical protein MNKW57_27320 [Microbulbifer sp. NKW57]
MHAIPAEEATKALVGHEFPGGSYKIAHWENFLLTGCTGAEPLPNGLAHPVALFHVPIMGAGTSIAEMFELGQAESQLSIIPESYDWEIFQSLKEEVEYDISGAVVAAERRTNAQGQTYDWVQFCFDVRSPEGTLSARSTITWQYTRNML